MTDLDTAVAAEPTVEELAQRDYQQLLAQQRASKRVQEVHNRYLELVEAGIASGEIPRRQTFADTVNTLADNQLQTLLKSYLDSQARAIANYNYVQIIENELGLRTDETKIDGKPRMLAVLGVNEETKE